MTKGEFVGHGCHWWQAINDKAWWIGMKWQGMMTWLFGHRRHWRWALEHMSQMNHTVVICDLLSNEAYTLKGNSMMCLKTMMEWFVPWWHRVDDVGKYLGNAREALKCGQWRTWKINITSVDMDKGQMNGSMLENSPTWTWLNRYQELKQNLKIPQKLAQQFNY